MGGAAVNSLSAAIGAFIGAVACYVIVSIFVIPVREEAARNGYVLESRAVAAEAALTETRRQLEAGQTVIASYQEIARNQFAREQAVAAETEQRIGEYEALLAKSGRSRLLTRGDIDFLRGKSSAPASGPDAGASASPGKPAAATR